LIIVSIHHRFQYCYSVCVQANIGSFYSVFLNHHLPPPSLFLTTHEASFRLFLGGCSRSSTRGRRVSLQKQPSPLSPPAANHAPLFRGVKVQPMKHAALLPRQSRHQLTWTSQKTRLTTKGTVLYLRALRLRPDLLGRRSLP
jgi:hypothetical protein